MKGRRGEGEMGGEDGEKGERGGEDGVGERMGWGRRWGGEGLMVARRSRRRTEARDL